MDGIGERYHQYHHGKTPHLHLCFRGNIYSYVDPNSNSSSVDSRANLPKQLVFVLHGIIVVTRKIIDSPIGRDLKSPFSRKKGEF